MFRQTDPDEPRIYFLPNAMTAGNLACGFFAVLTIFKGIMLASTTGTYDFAAAKPFYERAILLIFASCIFDLLDGRLHLRARQRTLRDLRELGLIIRGGHLAGEDPLALRVQQGHEALDVQRP